MSQRLLPLAPPLLLGACEAFPHFRMFGQGRNSGDGAKRSFAGVARVAWKVPLGLKSNRVGNTLRETGITVERT